jgi:hypothetical protein
VAPAAWALESVNNEIHGGCFWYNGEACQQVSNYNDSLSVPARSPTTVEVLWQTPISTLGWWIAPAFRPHEAAWNQAVAEGKPMVNVWHGEHRSLLLGYLVVVETGPECRPVLGTSTQTEGPCELVKGYLLGPETNKLTIANLKAGTKYVMRVEDVVAELPWAPAEGSGEGREVTTPKATAPLRARSRWSR